MQQRLVAALAALAVCTSAMPQKNVLFIVVDDFRPEINAIWQEPTQMYPKISTPNLDKFTQDAMVFHNAHCQQAVCAPSRTSLLTGRRPDTTRSLNLVDYWREVAGNFSTIPQYFKERGYRTLGMGKIFHEGLPAPDNDEPISWSQNEPYFTPPIETNYWKAIELDMVHRPINASVLATTPPKDSQSADYAVASLQRLAAKAISGEENFFMAVGIHLPHMPFLYPESYNDLYPISDMSLPTNPFAGVGMPVWNFDNNLEIGRYADVQAMGFQTSGPNTTWPVDTVKSLRQGYYASVSYMDSLVGQVLDAVDDLGLRENTIVPIISDHGWALYEHTAWGKKTNYDIATKSTNMWRVPGITDGGIDSHHLVEHVDLFSTMAELAGLDVPAQCPEDSRAVKECTEGVSMAAIMNDPTLPGKPRVFTQFPRDRPDGRQPDSYFKSAMSPTTDLNIGYSLVNERYRYSEYVNFDSVNYVPIWAELDTRELYDHYIDPEENYNRAGDARYASIIDELSVQLHEGWRGALPPTDFHCFHCTASTWDTSGRCEPTVMGRTKEDGGTSADAWGGTPVTATHCSSGRCYVEKDGDGSVLRGCIDEEPFYFNRSARCHTIHDAGVTKDMTVCICDSADNGIWMNRCNWFDVDNPYSCQAECTGGCMYSGTHNCDGGCVSGYTYDNVRRRCNRDGCTASGTACTLHSDCCDYRCTAGTCCVDDRTYCDSDSECCSGNCVNMSLWDDPDNTGRPYWRECRQAGYVFAVDDDTGSKKR